MVVPPVCNHHERVTDNAPPTADPPPSPPAGEHETSPTGAWAMPRVPPRFVRSRHDRKIAGVAGGLGRYTGVDPVVFRIVLVVLAIFGGSGLLLYGLIWLFVPEEGETPSGAQGLARLGTWSVVGAVALVAVGLIVFGGAFGNGFGAGGLLLLAAIGLAAYLASRSPVGPAASGATPGPGYPPAAPGAYGQTPGTAYAGHHGAGAAYAGGPQSPLGDAPHAATAAPAPPQQPRQPSILGGVTFGVALVVTGILLAVRAATDADIPFPVVPATALTIVGVGLLIGAFYGRSRLLIVLGVVLFLATAAATGVRATAGTNAVGVREWSPRSIADVQPSYRLGVGEATLDLSAVTPPAGRQLVVEAVLGAGDLTVVVPPNASLDIDIDASSATVSLLDEPDGAAVRDHDMPFGAAVRDETFRYDGESSAGTIVLDLRVGTGSVWVQHATS